MPSIEFVSNNICVLVQENENNETMGASGKVKENLVFWIILTDMKLRRLHIKNYIAAVMMKVLTMPLKDIDQNNCAYQEPLIKMII